MRFLIGMAALVWTLGKIGPLGWFLLSLIIATGFLAVWWAADVVMP